MQEPVTNLFDDTSGGGLVHEYFLLQKIIKVARSGQLQQQIQRLFIVEKCVQFDYVGMVQ